MQRFRGMPEITGKNYHSALSAGLTHTNVCEIFCEMGVHIPSRVYWYEFQRGDDRTIGWTKAVLDVWHRQKTALQRRLSQRDGSTPSILFVDC
ncbi:unnamed protein product [Calypogeia fissa]